MAISFGICPLSIIHGRVEPSSRTECVTQVLFGETFEVLEIQGTWSKLKLQRDHYECWLETEQLKDLSQAEYEATNHQHSAKTNDLSGVAVRKSDGSNFKLVLGSSLPFYDAEARTFRLGEDVYTYYGTVAPAEQEINAASLKPYLNFYLNAPYLWGGRTPYGTDCSGFVQAVLGFCGISLFRDAYQQAEQGETVNFHEEAQYGDLAFFDNFDQEHDRITHVGMILKTGEIIHAAGQVKVDRLDHQGIFDEKTGKYTHRLRVIKRYRA